MIAKIAVSAAIFAIDKMYSYRIPDGVTVLVGQRVIVPFGRGNRASEGVVLQIEEGAGEQLKPIEEIIDLVPVLSEDMLYMAAFLRDQYFCTFYEAIRAILPAGLWLSTRDFYEATELGAGYRETVKRNPTAREVMEWILEHGGRAEYGELRRSFCEEELADALRYLVRKNYLRAETNLLRRLGDKTEKMVALSIPPDEAVSQAEKRRKRAPLQAEVLRLLSAIGSASTKEVCYLTGASLSTIHSLERTELLTLFSREVLRRVKVENVPPARAFVLNDEQRAAYDGLCGQMALERPGAALLYGVTGSGKTAIYLKLICACLDRGKSALLLVPEIALTPQLLAILTAHFGELVAVLHSSLRLGERYDEWKRIQSGAARVVVGTRSAVFAPLSQPGLLIVDEEQEHTYKSENTPRYHACEVALYRGSREGALVLFGSATPSVETMYRARSGVYRLYELSRRYNGAMLPAALLVDLKQELQEGNGSSISTPLAAALAHEISKGHQAILFLNRRGSSRFVACVDCGCVPTCPRCSVYLTYHSANHRLMCHYCGYSEPAKDVCPDCGGHLKRIGAGTQKVEAELRERFPELEVLRMDADTVSAANHHEAILGRFRDEKIPILLGTQMVAKGLHFENVTLAAVLDADMSLYVGSFRAAETTFSLITQVVGRAGRGDATGTAMVQTMTPEHPVLELAAAQDYDRFYDMEIEIRRLRRAPPFADYFTLTFSGLSERQVIASANGFRGWVSASLDREKSTFGTCTLLGPAPAPVAKINNSYRYRLMLACKNTREIRRMLANLLRAFAKDKNNRGVAAFADVNTYDA